MELIKKLPPRKNDKGRWVSWAIFKCPNHICNKEVERRLTNGLRDKSCGCMKNSFISEGQKNNKNGFVHGESKKKLYKRWITMKQRCLNTEATGFNYYGGKGVIVCSEWLDNFETFKNWALSNDYQEGLEIDRTNPDG